MYKIVYKLGTPLQLAEVPCLGKPWRVDSWNTKVKSFVESRA